MISRIKPQYSLLKREQNHIVRSLPKKPNGSKHIVCHHCSTFGHLRLYCFKFQALRKKKSKEKRNLHFLEIVLREQN